MNISNEKLSFNKFCMQRFEDVAYVQLLLHPTERKIAIRPCQKEDPHSIRWRPDPEKPLYSKTLNCIHFGSALYKIMHWNPDFTYKIRGTFAERRGERIIVFNLVNAVPMMLVEAETADNERCRRIDLCPEEWDQDFGPEFYEHYLENGFYYIAPKTEWRSQAKSVHAFGNGTELSTAEQLQLTIDDLLRGTDSDNEN